MYISMKYVDAGHSIIRCEREDGSVAVVEQSMGDLWDAIQSGALGHVAAYVPPPKPTDAEMLDRERAEMRCSPAQMRLALHRAGRLADVQADADSDPEASIVWEYAAYIERNSPFIAALNGGDFTDTEIDDFFRSAMAI